MISLTSWLHRYISTMVFSLKLLAGLKMRRLVLLVSLLITGGATAGEDMEYSGDAGWREVEQSPTAQGVLNFHYKSWDWSAEDYHSYSSPFSLTLKIKSGRDMERFCGEFSWMSAQRSCPPEMTVKGTIYFSDSFEPLEGGGIWRERNDRSGWSDLIGWMSCAKDNSSCTLNFGGRKYRKDEEGIDSEWASMTPWFEVKITFNEDRSVKFLSGAVYPLYGVDEYYLVWHSKNLSQ